MKIAIERAKKILAKEAKRKEVRDERVEGLEKQKSLIEMYAAKTSVSSR